MKNTNIFRQIKAIIMLFQATQYGAVTNAIHQKLSSIVPETSVSHAVREQHGHDESHHPVEPPDIVVFPTEVEQICDVVKTCNEYRIPVIPFGTGTGLEGGVCAPYVCTSYVHVHTLLCTCTYMSTCVYQPYMYVSCMIFDFTHNYC